MSERWGQWFMIGFVLLGLYVHRVRMRWQRNPRREWHKVKRFFERFRR
jgi:hypothetical protein